MKWTIILLVAVGTAIPALAAPLDVTKTALVVSAPVPTKVPRSIPGAQVDYTITLSTRSPILPTRCATSRLRIRCLPTGCCA